MDIFSVTTTYATKKSQPSVLRGTNWAMNALFKRFMQAPPRSKQKVPSNKHDQSL